ncbi:hypothetical protein COHA_002667 [Chlorella ohadii]|uniref:Alpha-carbonic anhydrase domain-containing protein n=1 Tax=Chlorella ohadii TaxID=2649997 RepID=A0AAD5H497_9CHLO|nr:hypothetical protein COHA_002667 [Chlorella ohadii]
MAPDPAMLQRQSFLSRVSQRVGQELVEPPQQPEPVGTGRIVRVSAIDVAGREVELGERPSMTCKRNRTYTDAVYAVFGRWGFHAIGWIQHVNLVLTALAYTITGAQSLQTVARSICDQHGVMDGCFDRFWKWALIFAAVQFILIQLPNLNYFWWASVIGALMSFIYSTVAFGISVGNASPPQGSVGGIQFEERKDKASVTATKCVTGLVTCHLPALFCSLFAFSFSMILIEIQDTLKSPKGSGKEDTKGPVKPMKRAVNISVGIMTSFYLAIAVSGYAALGQDTPYNILTGFTGDQVPFWVIDFANVCVLVHMIPAYQVYSQPFLCFAEHHLTHWRRWPAWFKARRGGFIGAVGFWPMWIRVYKPERGYKLFLRSINVICFIITLATVIGSVGYSCLTGPNTWGGTCATQGFQSPIAINYDERFPPAGDPGLDILYPRFPRYIKEGVTVSMPEGVDYYLRGQRHRLLQFHFHTPSEHTLDGRHLAMEAHLVHKNLETGNLAVLGVFIEAGEGWMPHPVIAEAMRSAPRAAGVETPLQRAISLRTLLPNAREADGRRPYVNYSGSLTTPPCSTGVDWYVFLDPLQVDAEQIVDFMYYAGSGARPGVNARPPQPIGDRSLKYFAA